MSSGTWTNTPPAPIDAGSTAAGEVAVCYNAATQTYLAAWASTTGNQPVYSFYTGTWSPAAFIQAGGVVTANNISVATDGVATYLATWQNAGVMTYSFFTAGTWSTGTIVGSLTGTSVNCVWSGTAFWAIWSNGNATAQPVGAFWTGSAWTQQQISATGAPSDLVALSANISSNQLMATWRNNSTSQPWYSLWNGSSWSVAARMFTTTNAMLAIGGPATASDLAGNQFVAVFADGTNANRVSYSVFSAGAWSPAALLAGNVFATTQAPGIAYDSSLGLFAATWKPTSSPTTLDFSFLSDAALSAGWTTPQAVVPPGSATVAVGPNIVSNQQNQFLIGFQPTPLPAYTFLNLFIAPVSPVSPTTPNGGAYVFLFAPDAPRDLRVDKNCSARQHEHKTLVHLRWNDPCPGFVPVAYYEILRNDEVVDIQPAWAPNEFYPSQRQLHHCARWTVRSVAASGLTSFGNRSVEM